MKLDQLHNYTVGNLTFRNRIPSGKSVGFTLLYLTVRFAVCLHQPRLSNLKGLDRSSYTWLHQMRCIAGSYRISCSGSPLHPLFRQRVVTKTRLTAWKEENKETFLIAGRLLSDDRICLCTFRSRFKVFWTPYILLGKGPANKTCKNVKRLTFMIITICFQERPLSL